MGGWPNVNECERGVDRWLEPCKRLHKKTGCKKLGQLKIDFFCAKEAFSIKLIVTSVITLLWADTTALHWDTHTISGSDSKNED